MIIIQLTMQFSHYSLNSTAWTMVGINGNKCYSLEMGGINLLMPNSLEWVFFNLEDYWSETNVSGMFTCVCVWYLKSIDLRFQFSTWKKRKIMWPYIQNWRSQSIGDSSGQSNVLTIIIIFIWSITVLSYRKLFLVLPYACARTCLTTFSCFDSMLQFLSTKRSTRKEIRK